jgi:hypothetical protein
MVGDILHQPLRPITIKPPSRQRRVNGQRAFDMEQRERRRAYQAWRAEHRGLIAYDKRHRQQRTNNAVPITCAGMRRTGNKSLLGGSATTKTIERINQERRNVAGPETGGGPDLGNR